MLYISNFIYLKVSVGEIKGFIKQEQLIATKDGRLESIKKDVIQMMGL
jgi:hypothetical protein